MEELRYFYYSASTVPFDKVETGKVMFNLIIFSFIYPIEFWIYYQIQAPLQRFYFKYIYIPLVKRPLDKLWFWYMAKYKWK